MANATETADYLRRLTQAENLERAGINPFPPAAPRVTHLSDQLVQNFNSLKGTEVAIAGRMLPKRVHGGVTFAHVEDAKGKIQAVLEERKLGDRYQLVVDNFDEGDFIGVAGVLDKTRRGELSVYASRVDMLAKALRLPPDQVLDTEVQQRQRYIHTLVDGQTRAKFRVRWGMVQFMRDYFNNQLGCLEVETPVLDFTYGGASAKPFTTHHNALGSDFFLRISNELYLKRLTVGGFYEGVYEFSRNFRNEGMDRTHNPEFTLLELYKPNWDYYNMMDMAEDLVSSMVAKIHGTSKIPFGPHLIEYAKPWRRLSIYDGLRQKLNIEPTTISDTALQEIAHGMGVDCNTRGEILLKLFEEVWEKELIQPTFVMDYPAETSSLTKRHRDDPSLTERFELFVGGMETMNCYSELNDPRDQRARFELERRKRNLGDKEAMPFDEDFILAQEYGMPLQAGIGISVDRWAMLMTNTDHIRQVIYYPTLRPKSKG